LFYFNGIIEIDAEPDRSGAAANSGDAAVQRPFFAHANVVQSRVPSFDGEDDFRQVSCYLG
jgi:hypothetical protein